MSGVSLFRHRSAASVVASKSDRRSGSAIGRAACCGSRRTISERLRDVVERAGGHAMLMRADAETRGGVDVFETRRPGARAADALGEGRVRSARSVQSRPDVGRGLMRTNFTPTQLTDPHLAEAEKNLRACVHCGICTATCPTYVLLGDERDGPRGRIVMMQNMLEEGGAPSPETVLHVDRCLSCLACRTACPSSVDYARLIDEARVHIQTTYRRPLGDKLLRWLIATVMTAAVAGSRRTVRCAARRADRLSSARPAGADGRDGRACARATARSSVRARSFPMRDASR